MYDVHGGWCDINGELTRDNGDAMYYSVDDVYDSDVVTHVNDDNMRESAGDADGANDARMTITR